MTWRNKTKAQLEVNMSAFLLGEGKWEGEALQEGRGPGTWAWEPADSHLLRATRGQEGPSTWRGAAGSDALRRGQSRAGVAGTSFQIADQRSRSTSEGGRAQQGTVRGGSIRSGKDHVAVACCRGRHRSRWHQSHSSSTPRPATLVGIVSRWCDG